MFTSRAEYRLRLRADNADQRLTDKGIEIGCVDAPRREIWGTKKAALDEAKELMVTRAATPSELIKYDLKINQDGKRRSASELLRYADIGWDDLERVWPEVTDIPAALREQIEIDSLYSGYMDRQEADILAFRKDEALRLPENLDYAQVGSLSNEVRQKLETVRPATLGAAGRIPGVTPAALIALLRHVKKRAA